ncbi:DsbA family protein [Sansalvadorimonas sp. 2012CJ34-2]|uniref:DsbA family protein n=1 Tax=Parendozoicomonas callyspongiae TaxID=2942213 RepID=A0ABT0PK44_9GAMM|nr:thioredoxin domain-containing protein [Sansalvadorimonas sp. 2012CJ34-2]MCL6271346.1 DsbA family protein [Sansalvadorimonas sp. 2012CJ34-2]
MDIKLPLALVLGAVVGSGATFLLSGKPAENVTSDAVLSMGGVNYALEDLPPAVSRAVFDIDNEAWQRKVQVITGAAGEMFVKAEVDSSGRDRQAVVTELLDLREPAEEDITSFYESNKDRIPAPLDQVRDQIRNYLMGQGMQAGRDALTERLRQEKGMKILLAKPEAPLNVIDTQGFPVKGNPQAKTTLVKFADYQCPHCYVAAETLDELMEQVGDKVKMVYMDFPINSSGISREVALGAVCADEQGKFWEYNKAAFIQHRSLNEDSRLNLAKELGLNMETFESCLASDRPEKKVARAEDEAERLGLTGTPSFFVNGKVLQPENLEDGLVEAVREAIGLN